MPQIPQLSPCFWRKKSWCSPLAPPLAQGWKEAAWELLPAHILPVARSYWSLASRRLAQFSSAMLCNSDYNDLCYITWLHYITLHYIIILCSCMQPQQPQQQPQQQQQQQHREKSRGGVGIDSQYHLKKAKHSIQQIVHDIYRWQAMQFSHWTIYYSVVISWPAGQCGSTSSMCYKEHKLLITTNMGHPRELLGKLNNWWLPLWRGGGMYYVILCKYYLCVYACAHKRPVCTCIYQWMYVCRYTPPLIHNTGSCYMHWDLPGSELDLLSLCVLYWFSFYILLVNFTGITWLQT